MAMIIRYFVEFPNSSTTHAEIKKDSNKIFRCSFFSLWEKAMIELKDSYTDESEALTDLRRAIMSYYKVRDIGIHENARLPN